MNIDFDLIVNYLWENITFEVFLKFVVVYFCIIWISLIVWVVKDISNRTENIFLQLLSILIIVGLSPFGIFIYLMIRPSKTLFEKYYEEIEDNLDVVEEIVEEKNDKEEEVIHCFKCNFPVSHDFKYCPNCRVELKKECSNCSKIINAGWKNCPYCGEENIIKKTNKSLENIIPEIKHEEKLEEKIYEIEEKVDKIINEQEYFMNSMGVNLK